MSISGGLVGSYSSIGKTFILEDSDGNTINAVVVDRETVFNATPADVKIGKVFASEDGISVGTDTKTYRTSQGSYLVLPGNSFSVPFSKYDQYNYTGFQCIIAKFNSSFNDSVETDRVVIKDNVYQVNSTSVISRVTKNISTKSVDLNIVNDTESFYVIHYMTYKEE